MDNYNDSSPIIFQTQFRTWKILVFLPIVLIMQYVLDDDPIDMEIIPFVAVFFIVIFLIFMKKLILYNDRIQISHPFAKFRDKMICLNDIEEIDTDNEWKDLRIKLKAGSKIKVSTVLM